MFNDAKRCHIIIVCILILCLKSGTYTCLVIYYGYIRILGEKGQ